MKRLIVITLIILSICMTAAAQRGLYIDELFDEIRTDVNVTETYASGSQLRRFGGQITLYHSLRVQGDAKLVKKVESALSKDVSKVTDKEVVYRHGRLTYGLYILSSATSDIVKAILYSSDDVQNASLIYIEGKTSSAVIRNLLQGNSK